MSVPNQPGTGQKSKMLWMVALLVIIVVGAGGFIVSRQRAQAAADAQAQNNPRWQNYLKDSGKAADATQAAFEQRQAQLAAKRQKQGNAKP